MAKKNKGGRPKLENPRTTQIMVRVTPYERERIRAMAGDRGAAELMRSLVLNRKPRLPLSVPELNQSAWIELSRVASNLNQLAHHMNTGGTASAPDLQQALARTLDELAKVRALLISPEAA